jgi:hypothetical protein
MGATRRNLQAYPKILKKIIGTPNLPIKTKMFQKKLCFVPLKPKIHMGATRRNSPREPEKQ